METKKTGKADLTKKSEFLFSIGLLVTMSIIVMAFEWKDNELQTDLGISKNTNPADELLDIPLTEIPPPPPPQIKQPPVIEVPNEEKIKDEIINIDVEIIQDTKIEPFEIKIEDPKEDVEDIISIVEEPATPKGGIAAFYQYVKANMKYPPQATRIGIEGKVYVEFVINRDGSIVDVKTVRGIGAGCDEEAMRVVKSSPPWNPGKQRGKPVRQRYTIPIQFKLN